MASRCDRRRTSGRATVLRAPFVAHPAGTGPTPQPIGQPAAQRTPATPVPEPKATRSSTHRAPTQETPTQEPPAGCAPSGPVVGMGSRPSRKARTVTGPDGIAVTEHAGRAPSLPASHARRSGGRRPVAQPGTAALRTPVAIAEAHAPGP